MLRKKIDQACRIIEAAMRSPKECIIANSGGKDSLVLYDIAYRVMGVDIRVVHSNTTIDPPGTLSYIRKVMPKTEIVNPVESFAKLVQRKGFPVRRTRYCCEMLKERYGVGRMNIEGVRSDESRSRQGRDYIQCDTRVSMRGAEHAYPLYDFTTRDIWAYIVYNDLAVAPSYYMGLPRLGCVGCPMVSAFKRRREFEMYPRYRTMLERAIRIGMNNNPQWKLTACTGGDPSVAFDWWLSGQTMNQYFKLQRP
jgi:phosphoadenosine phosphosulfate reductase